jgi:hypothetical protein
MISFILRLAFFAFLGMLLNPGQLAHQLPTHRQILRFEHEIAYKGGIQHMLTAECGSLRKDFKRIHATVVDLQTAFADLRHDLAASD